jgi:hypothetical protein
MYSFGYQKKVATSKYMTTAIIYDHILIAAACSSISQKCHYDNYRQTLNICFIRV